MIEVKKFKEKLKAKGYKSIYYVDTESGSPAIHHYIVLTGQENEPGFFEGCHGGEFSLDDLAIDSLVEEHLCGNSVRIHYQD